MLEELRLEIEKAKPAPGMSVKIVAIDGHGGAGKTFLANKLATQLKAEILHTDDFASWDNPMDWWPRLVKEALEPIKSGAQSLNYKRSSWYKTHKPAPVVNQPITPIILVEGVSSSRKEFRPYLAYSVWVETPKPLCLQRGIARDLADNEAGKSEKDIKEDWRKWHAYEEEYIKRDKPQVYADTIIKGTSDE